MPKTSAISLRADDELATFLLARFPSPHLPVGPALSSLLYFASDKTGGGECACCIVIGFSLNTLFITFNTFSHTYSVDQSQSNYQITNKQNKPFKLTRERTVHIYFQQIRYERGNSHTVSANFCWRSAHTSATPVGQIHFFNRADSRSKPSRQQPTFVGGTRTLSDYAY